MWSVYVVGFPATHSLSRARLTPGHESGRRTLSDVDVFWGESRWSYTGRPIPEISPDDGAEKAAKQKVNPAYGVITLVVM